jgi:hypothetical protein
MLSPASPAGVETAMNSDASQADTDAVTNL